MSSLGLCLDCPCATREQHALILSLGRWVRTPGEGTSLVDSAAALNEGQCEEQGMLSASVTQHSSSFLGGDEVTMALWHM